MEIYNEIGYDLLNRTKNVNQLEDLPRVVLLDDNKGQVHLRNLSVLPITDESQAYELLIFGDNNRTISETYMNQYSSRSHCIFTIHVISRGDNSKIRNSKLNLVDLAGSEYCLKCTNNNYNNGSTRGYGSSSVPTNETKCINLSLYYLEQVIIALSEKKKGHIPYRNSMMTLVLKDSLSGNCLTAMIANLSLHYFNVNESVLTCRFAQRVASIKTKIYLNESFDPIEEMNSLRNENDDLKQRINILMKNQRRESLLPEDYENCKKIVSSIIKKQNFEFFLKLDVDLIWYCFQLFVDEIDKLRITKEQCDNSKITEKYKNIIKQRNYEISILINLLRKERNKNNKSCQTNMDNSCSFFE